MCTSPRTAYHSRGGGRITFSARNADKSQASFQVPCSKCIECRLNYSRTWAIRATHEAQMHPQNTFITLTYDDQHLRAPTLAYDDFQRFMKRLRKKYPNTQIGFMACGEYGEKNGRKHWHAILFNFDFPDKTPEEKTTHGDITYQSKILDDIWQNGRTQIGSVNFKSAAYVARYCLKKTGDKTSDPIFKTSRLYGIGNSWLEKYYPDILNGKLVTQDKTLLAIPRHYINWLKKNKLTEWKRYVTEKKYENYLLLKEKNEKNHFEWLEALKKNYKTRSINQQRALYQKIKQSKIERKI